MLSCFYAPPSGGQDSLRWPIEQLEEPLAFESFELGSPDLPNFKIKAAISFAVIRDK